MKFKNKQTNSRYTSQNSGSFSKSGGIWTRNGHKGILWWDGIVLHFELDCVYFSVCNYTSIKIMKRNKFKYAITTSVTNLNLSYHFLFWPSYSTVLELCIFNSPLWIQRLPIIIVFHLFIQYAHTLSRFDFLAFWVSEQVYLTTPCPDEITHSNK